MLAVVIHPDGTGVGAESDNGTFPNLTVSQRLIGLGKGHSKTMEHVTRVHPTYTVEQLGQVAVAVDKAATQCVVAHCSGS